MRWINILLPAAVVLASATMTVAWAEGMDEDALVEKWTNERDAAVAQLISKWLGAAPKPEADKLVREIIRLEALLGSVSKKVDDLYLSALDPKDFRNVSARILEIYLERKGLQVETVEFFEGKSFTVTRKVAPVPTQEHQRKRGRSGTSARDLPEAASWLP